MLLKSHDAYEPLNALLTVKVNAFFYICVNWKRDSLSVHTFIYLNSNDFFGFYTKEKIKRPAPITIIFCFYNGNNNISKFNFRSSTGFKVTKGYKSRKILGYNTIAPRKVEWRTIAQCMRPQCCMTQKMKMTNYGGIYASLDPLYVDNGHGDKSQKKCSGSRGWHMAMNRMVEERLKESKY